MEKIISNCDVLGEIFRYLDIKEHLKLLKICPQFEYAIVHGVWRLICKNLRFSHSLYGDDSFLKCNDVMTKCSLTPEQFHIILQHSSMYIQKLELKDIRCSEYENILSFNYYHLTELTIDGIVEDTQLQQVARNCLNLQSFSLKGLSKSSIHANVFGEMKALNKLEIGDYNFRAWNYFDVQQLFSLAHLKTLSINIYIGHGNANIGNNKNSTDRVYNIENLTIGVLPSLESGILCLIDDLKRFKNLTKLSMTSFSRLRLDDNVLTQINNACPKLCELSFFGSKLRFKEFPRMNNLMHLTFEHTEIALVHFDEIFRKLKLKTLTLVTCILKDGPENISKYNYISNTLETLIIRDFFDVYIYSTFFNRQHKFENVSKVRLDVHKATELSKGLCFSYNFPYLQELIMNTFYIPFDDILLLKHLKVLQFKQYANMSWSNLENLFKHPALTHITIEPCFGQVLKRSTKCYEGLTTRLEYLSLPTVVYESYLSFWPSFRQRNKLLKFEIVDCDTLKRRAVPI